MTLVASASTVSLYGGSRTSSAAVMQDAPELMYRGRETWAPTGHPFATANGSSPGVRWSSGSIRITTRELDAPRDCGDGILPPTVHPVHTLTLHPVQEWQGCVTAIRPDDNEFVADLLDLTAGHKVEMEEAFISMDELSPSDRSRLALGSYFWWVLGYEAFAGEARKRVSQIILADLPPITKADLERGRQWADWLHERWGLE